MATAYKADKNEHHGGEGETHPRLIVGFAVLATLAGLVLVAQMVLGGSPAVALNTEGKQDDLSVWVTQFEWVHNEHGGGDDHEHAEGEEHDDVDPQQEAIDDLTAQAEVFAMPATMMSGTPAEGFQRIQIEVSVLNRGIADADIHPNDFHLLSATGQTWLTLRGGTFGSTTIGPSHELGTVIAYDIPEEEAAADMQLVWQTEGGEVRFALNGSEHSHG